MTDVFDTAMTKIFRKLGSEATFTPATGSAVSGIYVNLMLDSQVQGMDAGVVRIVPTIEYIISDLGREAVEGETFTITDENSVSYNEAFAVCERVAYDGRTATVTVK